MCKACTKEVVHNATSQVGWCNERCSANQSKRMLTSAASPRIVGFDAGRQAEEIVRDQQEMIAEKRFLHLHYRA